MHDRPIAHHRGRGEYPRPLGGLRFLPPWPYEQIAQLMTPQTPTPSPTMQTLLAELVELGRQAWLISVQEKAVRAQINALHEKEENPPHRSASHARP